MDFTSDEIQLRPLQNGWLGKINEAIRYRKPYMDVAEQCMAFYTSTLGFMWKPEYKRKFFKNASLPNPDFQITIAKAFELVALFGPMLYNRNPIRAVRTRKALELPPDAFGDPNNPMVQQMAQQVGMMEAQRQSQNGIRAQLLERYLNWTPGEQPNGGLQQHAEDAITEALIKGRGVVWCLSGGTEVYAKYGERHTVMRVRDLYRQDWRNISLWDGGKWVRVVGATKKDKDGTELQLTMLSGESINCTREHRWPTERGIVTADKLQSGDVLSTCILPAPENPIQAEYVPDDIGWFVGLYVAEGHMPKGRNSRIEIAGHVKETDRYARLDTLVAKYGGKMELIQSEGSLRLDARITSPVLAAILREYVAGDGCFFKHLASKCWERSNEFLAGVLDGYLHGDGHFVENENCWRLRFCDNRNLAKSLRTLAARLGYQITLRETIERFGKSTKTIITGRIMLRKSERSFKADKAEIVKIGPANWRSDCFYDISVESEPHLFSLSSGVLTHNCDTYKMPASPTLLTGLFYDTQDNVLIDPDATDISDAMWIARKCTHPIWKAQRDYPRSGDLQQRGNDRSAENSGRENDDPQREAEGEYAKRYGRSHDLLTYWKIWSKCGVGTRLKGVSKDMNKGFDQVVGDYAYIVVADSVPYPLNTGPNFLETASSKAVKQAFSWPLPFWADGRWPCAMLDFYKEPGSPYPVAPLKPGLGELTALNIIVSHLVGRIRSSSRDFVAVLESQAKAVEGPLRNGEDLSIILLKGATGDVDINKVVQFLQQPQTNFDVWKIIDALFQLFDKRTGLTELVYGITETESRTAADAQNKRQGVSIRPDYMASRVEKWLTEASQLERLALYFGGVTGQSVQPLLGQAGAMLWDQLITNEDPEVVLRELDVTVEAGSARKPNKDRDVANVNELMRNFGQTFEGYRQQSGDVNPTNALLREWGNAADMNVSGMMLQPPPPPDPNKPDPEQQELQMRQAEMQAELQMKQQESGLKMELEKIKLQMAQAKGQQELALAERKAQIELQLAQMKMAMEAEKTRQELMQDKQAHALDMQQMAEERVQRVQDAEANRTAMMQENRIKMMGMQQQSQAKTAATVAQGKAQAAAARMQPKKPTTNGAGNGKR